MIPPAMKTAVIATPGKQYVVEEGQTVQMDRLPQEVGEKVVFENILLAATDKTTKIGTPDLSGAKVEGEVIEQARHKKIYGVKMKPKKRSKKYFGHKQHYTAVKITKITVGK